MIINNTAAMQIATPAMIFVVSDSLKTIVPTKIAVTGSKAPMTAVLVGPIRRVERAMVSIAIIVGKIAKPMRFSTSAVVSIPCSTCVPSISRYVRKAIAPTTKP